MFGTFFKKNKVRKKFENVVFANFNHEARGKQEEFEERFARLEARQKKCLAEETQRDLIENLGISFPNPDEAAKIGLQNYLREWTAQLENEDELARAREQNDSLQEMVFIDPLTGLYNRHALKDKIIALENKLKRYTKTPLAEQKLEGQDCSPKVVVVALDIDYFKCYNDALGHDFGDEVLQKLAQKLREELRETDMIFRMGGEEFVILIEEPSFQDLEAFLERVRLSSQKINLKISPMMRQKLREKLTERQHQDNPDQKNLPRLPLRPTLSVGGILLDFQDQNLVQKLRATPTGQWQSDEIGIMGKALQIVDQATYFSKENGRNKSTIAVFTNDEFEFRAFETTPN